MKRIGLVASVISLLATGCSFADTTAPTLLAPEPGVTSTTATKTTTTTAPPSTTTTQSVTTTTLAPIPAALPIVSDPWEWEKLLEIEYTRNARYDSTYLVYQEPDDGSVIALRDGVTTLVHTPPTDEEWIVQDVELGDRWLAIAENTEATRADQTHLVVYDLLTGEVVFEEFGNEVEDQLSIPHMSLSGRYMALAQGQEADPNCVAIYDLGIPLIVDEICGEGPVYTVELDGNFFSFETTGSGCRSAWTGTLYGRDHNLAEHTNRECWSNSPVGGDQITVWFETPPDGSGGIDTIIGATASGEPLGLGKGARGRAEVCWNRVFWSGGNRDIRMWDGGDTVATIHVAGGEGGGTVSCLGPWVTFATSEGIYTANMFTRSSLGACDVVEIADSGRTADLASTLGPWAQGQSDELPSDLTATVSDAVGSGGWWVGRGIFSDYLEGAIFAWSPDGEIAVAWSGSANSEYDLRQYMLSLLPDVPPALFGCVHVDGFFGR